MRELSSPELLANVERQSRALREGLAALNDDLELFAEIRGRGLLLGAQLREMYAGRAGEILDRCAERGLLLLQAGPDVLRFVPPLNIVDADVAEGMSRLRAALAGCTSGSGWTSMVIGAGTARLPWGRLCTV